MSMFWKIFLSVTVSVMVSGGGTFWVMQRQINSIRDANQTTIDNLNKDLTKFKTQSASPSPTSTASTTPSPSASANAYLYTNSKYGFTLTFNSKWKGYSVVETAPSGDPHATAYLYACVPTSDSSWQDVAAAVYCPFSISVATLANKAAYEADNSQAEVPTYIKSNANYAFYYSWAQAEPSDGATVWGDRQNVINTFATL